MMPSSPNTPDAWSGHPVRQIRAAALSVSSVLENPSEALPFAADVKAFLADVEHLEEGLAPCEQWSADARTRPQGMSPALLDALFALWMALQRLDLHQLPGALSWKCADDSCPKPLRARFQQAAHHLDDLVRRQASQDEKKSPCNGPEPPDKVHYQGHTETLPPLPFRLVQYMWEKGQAVQSEEVVDHVWGHDSEATESAIKSAISVANACLVKLQVPWSLGRKGAYIQKK
jgi:hypothetical protein